MRSIAAFLLGLLASAWIAEGLSGCGDRCDSPDLPPPVRATYTVVDSLHPELVGATVVVVPEPRAFRLTWLEDGFERTLIWR
jgi:hypothetical protein